MNLGVPRGMDNGTAHGNLHKPRIRTQEMINLTLHTKQRTLLAVDTQHHNADLSLDIHDSPSVWICPHGFVDAQVRPNV